VDLVLDEKARRAGETEEKNLEHFEKWDGQDHDYAFRGMFRPGKTDHIISDHQTHMGIGDVIKRKREGKPVIPVFYHMESGTWILSDSDQDAVMSGYICENCLEWQEIPNAPTCNSVSGFSCGWKNH
jgi:hypothetical protein